MSPGENRAYRHQTFSAGDFALNGIHLALREACRVLPYERRMMFARKLGRVLLSRVPSYTKRSRENLQRIFPDRPDADHDAIRAACFENIGQSLFEHMFVDQFSARTDHLNASGAGVEAVTAGQPAIFITGHFGQWEGVRIMARHLSGKDCAFLYRPNNNGFYDRHWRTYLETAGRPAVARGRDGRDQMRAHLDGGGSVLFANDQHRGKADYLDFMGHPARTATTAAALAVEYGIPLIPAYAIRQQVPLHYDVVFEAPIPAGRPEDMILAANASLGALVRTYPEQYLWTHRRWR